MDPAALRTFAGRDWSAVAVAKRDHWILEYRRHGAGPARLASTRLWQHARRLHPAFPDTADRMRDLDDHLALRQRLDAAARALARR